MKFTLPRLLNNTPGLVFTGKRQEAGFQYTALRTVGDSEDSFGVSSEYPILYWSREDQYISVFALAFQHLLAGEKKCGHKLLMGLCEN